MKSFLRLQFVWGLFTLVFTSCDDEKVAPQNRLVAVAGEDQAILLNTAVDLDGSLSSDGNHETFSYHWTIQSKPEGSSASIDTPAAEKTTFTPDRTGTYIIRLTISHNTWTAHDELSVTVMSPEPNDHETIILSEDINSDLTLNDIFEDSSHPDYLVTNDIDVRAQLTVMPGVVVAFAENTGLELLSGAFIAKGTPEKSIVFKGAADQPAYWKGILLHSNSALNAFDHVTIKQGGSDTFTESGVKANLAVAGSEFFGGAVSISHSVISESGGYGLYVKGASLLSLFFENAFADNAGVAAYIPAHQLHNIVFEGSSGIAEIETGGLILEDTERTWKSVPNGHYLISSEILVRAGITIEPGAVFRIKNGITINVDLTGYLRAVGTESEKIVFTSTAENVYWNGLFFNSYNVNNQLGHVEVSHAGLNRIADADFHANIVVGPNGMLAIDNSLIRDGLGYGVVAKTAGQINQDVAAVNTFSNLENGFVYPDALNYPDLPDLEGEWVDAWSFNKGYSTIAADFYDPETGTWFEGASSPWLMEEGNGFGIHFDADGTFTWNIAEHSPMTGCESFSAEHITGTASWTSDMIYFDQDYWRSMFINKCDESQNVDTGVTPIQVQLPYEINKLFHATTGAAYWELKFINPDNSTFSLYRQAD